MERLISGEDVTGTEETSGRNAYCSFYALVRKGHGECGDSAFIYADKDKSVFAVFDGVSGEPGAAMASSDAARAMLGYLKSLESAGEAEMQEAFTKGHLAIRLGATTASVLFLKRDGSFIIAAIGDSPVYGFSAGGSVSVELPLARAVADGDSIMKFFYYRNLVTSVLGSPGELNLHMRKGKLGPGEMLIMASDGLSDNLKVKVKDGYVVDSSGRDDLKALVALSGNSASAPAIARKIAGELEARVASGKLEEKGTVMVPKEDDISIIVVRKA